MLFEAGIQLPLGVHGERNRQKLEACAVEIVDENSQTDSPTPLSTAMIDKVLYRKALFVLADSGIGAQACALFLNCSMSTVYYWGYRRNKTDNLCDRSRSGRPAIYTEDTHLKAVAFYCQTQPLPNCGRWTLRWAARYLQANPKQIDASPGKTTLHRILNNNKLKPHQSCYFLHITDPDFFPKMEHLVAMYMNPPRNLFFFDECPGIQILKRLTPDLQTEEMKKRLEEFEYIRNGTMDVFAFLNHADGKVYAECHGNHKTTILLEVFRHHVSIFPETEQLNYVMDNLSSHRCYPFCQVVAELSAVECPSEKELNTQAKRVEWLQSEKKRIVIHFTPYHGSWLNLIEIWFGIMGGKVLRESFGSPEAFKKAFDAFVEQWNCLLAHPFNWSYEGKGLHELAVKRFTKMLHSSADQMEIRILTKMFMLMTNLLSNYFSKVSENSWGQLAETASLQYEAITNNIANEDGPKRKKKVEKALKDFTEMLNKCLPHHNGMVA